MNMSARAVVTGPGRLQFIDAPPARLRTGDVVVLEVIEGGRSAGVRRTALDLEGCLSGRGAAPVTVEAMEQAVLAEAARLHWKATE